MIGFGMTAYYTAASPDGFIATADHSLDWLLSREVDEHGPQGPAPFIEARPPPWPFAAPCWTVWLVGGGDLVGQFHDAGLLDEVRTGG